MEVTYMNGAGNDFMVIDGRGLDLDYAALALELCDITGADGFMAVDHSQIADFKLHFYNADGSRGEMCGNGSRCICRFARELGIVGETMTVETDAGLVYGWHLEGERYRVRLNTPTTVDLHRKGDIAYVELGNPGLPHAVREYQGDLWADAEKLLPEMEALRHDPAFPKGANVNYYSLVSDTEVNVLTFERGVEDFTLACGTGCGSIATVLYLSGRLPGKQLRLNNRGGVLTVRLQAEETVEAIFQEGPTEIVKIYDIEI